MKYENKIVKSPGVPCPVCGGFIPASVPELLSGRGLECPSCGLFLEIDRQGSERALKALAKLDKAQRQVDATQVFNR